MDHGGTTSIALSAVVSNIYCQESTDYVYQNDCSHDHRHGGTLAVERGLLHDEIAITFETWFFETAPYQHKILSQ